MLLKDSQEEILYHLKALIKYALLSVKYFFKLAPGKKSKQ